MKSLAGANPEAKPDYRSQAMTELNKLESKVILLNEMLDNVDTTHGEKFASGDVYDVRRYFLESCKVSSLVLTASRVDIEVCPSKTPEMGFERRNRRSRVVGCVRFSILRHGSYMLLRRLPPNQRSN